jgi:hypothetical protein
MKDVVAMFSEEKVDEQIPRFYLQFQSLRMKGSAYGMTIVYTLIFRWCRILQNSDKYSAMLYGACFMHKGSYKDVPCICTHE